MSWITISEYEELPDGTWLVEVDKEDVGNPYHVAVVSSATGDGHKMIIIGNHFKWDMPKPVRYRAIPD